MRKILLFFILCFFSLIAKAQFIPVVNPYSSAFLHAYQLYPSIPVGALEAVAYNQTRFEHLNEAMPSSCTGMPQYLGVMGLIENGKGYFNENLKLISSISGLSTDQIKSDPEAEIEAYAAAYSYLLDQHHVSNGSPEQKIKVLSSLSEIPVHLGLKGNEYAMDAFLYGIISFLNTSSMQEYYGFHHYKLNGELIMGDDAWDFMMSETILISKTEILNENHTLYKAQHELPYQPKSADYAPALWNAAATCNYSSRSGTPVSAVTIHTVQGTYSGCISWFQNCAASVSAHYVLRSSDGQVTQMVLESDKAWHVGTENPYTVGLEHEGYVTNPAWYTNAMYTASAALVVDIANGYGISKIRTMWFPWSATTEYASAGIPGGCMRIKGHQHFPNQTHNDPGVNWDWNKYFKLIHPAPAVTNITGASGTFYDSGGGAGNYTDDERTIWTIAPAGASSVTVTFSSFNLESTWDYLYIYDGATIDAPLIGYYTGTTGPGTITSSSGSLTFEFRSDCSTNAAGWNATYTSTSIPVPVTDTISPLTSVMIGGVWQTADFNADFTDADEPGGSGLKKSFYHVSYYDGTGHYANAQRGFFRDEFDNPVMHPQWTTATGTWAVTGGYLHQSDEASTNTNIYASLKQDLSNVYVYEFNAAISGTGTTRRAGFHFFCDSAQLTNRGNSYFVWFRLDDQKLEFYKVVNDVFTLQHSVSTPVTASTYYNYKVIYDRVTGNIKVFRNNVLLGEWTDSSPLSTGKYISFRSGNAVWDINNIRVYRSRYSNSPALVTVGNCVGCDLIYQNINPSAPAGHIFSFSQDSADNLSGVVYEPVNVDWTVPELIAVVNDVSIFDEDTIYNNGLAGANWSFATDTNSDVAAYYYCIGTSAGDSNVVNWTNNSFYNNFVDTLTLLPNQWYYTSVRAANGAGLINAASVSDGFIFMYLGNEEEGILPVQVFPNPCSEWVNVHMQGYKGKLIYDWFDMKGSLIQSSAVNMENGYVTLPVPLATNGIYMVRLTLENGKRLYVKVKIEHS